MIDDYEDRLNDLREAYEKKLEKLRISNTKNLEEKEEKFPSGALCEDKLRTYYDNRIDELTRAFSGMS